MIVHTLFKRGASFVRGEVEVKLMPGIPQLHVVGLPDRSIRECGVRLKSALKSAGYAWPRGHQVVVNLRPSYERKESAGVDLAIALAVLAATGQLSDRVAAHLDAAVAFGELALDGRVFAPADVGRALLAVADQTLLTGAVGAESIEGRWLELARLDAPAFTPRVRAGGARLVPPPPPAAALRLNAGAYEALWLTAHLGLSALVAGPQGTGKSTWARLVHQLSPPPDPRATRERAALFGDEANALPWRPLEHPHHTTPPPAMIGGGRPLRPGVLSRAHGGVLIMDEFLEFHPRVLEALRQPMETGTIEVARLGQRECLPARLQLIATSNLCPCGLATPEGPADCGYNPTTCKRICARLSGPVLDRFDLLVPSHEWLGDQRTVSAARLPSVLARLGAFAAKRGNVPAVPVVHATPLSHRRRQAIAKVARGFADFDENVAVTDAHLRKAYALVVAPIEKLRRIFR